MATIRNTPPDRSGLDCRRSRLVYNGLQIEAKGRVDVEAGRHPHHRVFQVRDGSPFENGEGLVAIRTGTCILHSMLKRDQE